MIIEAHLEFEYSQHGDLLYIRCKQHPGIMFVFDKDEVNEMHHIMHNGRRTEWRNLLCEKDVTDL